MRWHGLKLPLVVLRGEQLLFLVFTLLGVHVVQVPEAVRQVHVPALQRALLLAALLPETRATLHGRLLQASSTPLCIQAEPPCFVLAWEAAHQVSHKQCDLAAYASVLANIF